MTMPSRPGARRLRGSARALIPVALVAAVALAGCLGGKPPAPPTPPSDGPPAELLACPAPGWLANGTLITRQTWGGENPVATVETTLGAYGVEVLLEQVPVTATNFLDLAKSGFYEGILYHRVVPGFMIQTGDPKTKDPALEAEWGTGGSDKIPDEFHAALRHDLEGVLSMANSGPNTGSSQFFTTVAAAPWLDDKHAVFGKVVAGMDVVRAIAQAPTDGDPPAGHNRPLEPISIQRLTISEPDGGVTPERKISTYAFRATRDATPGSAAPLMAVVKNAGDARAPIVTAVRVPEGWGCSIEAGGESFTLPAGQSRGVIFRVTPPSTSPYNATVEFLAAPADDLSKEVSVSFSLSLTVFGEAAGPGRPGVSGNYIGILEDGRMFDTSHADVARSSVPKLEALFQLRDAYEPLSFTIGSGVIQGFSNAATGTREGETAIVRVPPADGYGETPPPACQSGGPPGCILVGKALIFELTIVSAQA